jgi:hypothetical protein
MFVYTCMKNQHVGVTKKIPTNRLDFRNKCVLIVLKAPPRGAFKLHDESDRIECCAKHASTQQLGCTQDTKRGLSKSSYHTSAKHPPPMCDGWRNLRLMNVGLCPYFTTTIFTILQLRIHLWSATMTLLQLTWS